MARWALANATFFTDYIPIHPQISAHRFTASLGPRKGQRSAARSRETNEKLITSSEGQMCIAFFVYQRAPGVRLILAFNRDEYLDR